MDLSVLKDFFEIEHNEHLGETLFKILNKVIDFDGGNIYYTEPKKLIYSYGKSNKNANISTNLKIKKTKFGEIILYGNSFSNDDKENLEICSHVISNIIKDDEISKIMKLHVEALQKGYTEIKQANDAKTKFLSHVSHELRTPLNSIIGYADLLNNEFVGKLNSKQKEYINDIKVSGINLLEMINDILDMSKIEANALKLNKQEFDVSTLINEVENIISPLFIAKQQIFTKQVENFKIYADYQKIQQVIFNILSNAIKYTQSKGKISLTCYNDNEFAFIEIKDNGIGIDKKYHRKIFEKFEQADTSAPNSSGLGLTISKEIIKLHNGEIFLQSSKNKGAKFVIKLPIAISG